MAATARNRNAIRSQKMLYRAFSELLAEKPFDKITVTDITRRAGLSRGTFYAHYDSTSDLLNSMTDDIMSALFDAVDTAASGGFLDDPDPVIELIADYIGGEESLFRALLGTSAADPFIAYMKRSVTKRLLAQIDPGEVFPDELSQQVSVTYMVGGLIDLTCAYLRGDYGNATSEQISAVASRLVRTVKAGYVAARR